MNWKKMWKAPSCILLLLLPLFSGAMIIVRDHQPMATIIVAPDVSVQVKDAAKLLQDYIRQSTGATLPISQYVQRGVCLHIGMTPYVSQHKINISHLDEDGFLFKGINDKNFVIIGGSDWGTEFGVHDFLERYLGVRWLMPTDIGIDIPRHTTLDISSKNIIENPVYISRQLSGLVSPAEQQWGHFNRIRGRISLGENLYRMFPPGEFAQSHPEFYPLINGKRYTPSNDNETMTWQPNFSAAGIADAGARQIIKYFEENPDAPSYSLGINDTQGKYDESSPSLSRRSGKKNYLGLEDVSDDYFMWANEVVQKVNKVYPDKIFGCLAYNNVAAPPAKVKADAHIIPFITYERMRWANEALQQAGHERTLAWGKVAPVLGWYDYAYGLCYMVPREWFHVMQKYLSWGAAHHVKYYYAELGPNWGEGPRAWVLTKLLWNPNQDVDSLLQDWYVHAAGNKAAPKLKAFYAIWERFWTKDIYHSKWNTMADQYLPFSRTSYLLDVPQSYLQQSDSLMAGALRLAETPAQKERVGKLNEMWQLYKAAVIVYWQSYSLGTRERVGETETPEIDRVRNLFAKLKKDTLFSTSIRYMIRWNQFFKDIDESGIKK